MLVKNLIERFLKKGKVVDEFHGAKFLTIKNGSNEYVVTRGRGPKETDIPNLPVKSLVMACDAWDPSLRVRGYGCWLRPPVEVRRRRSFLWRTHRVRCHRSCACMRVGRV